MKITILLLIPIFLSLSIAYGQVSGNVNYNRRVQYTDDGFNVETPSNTNIIVSAKGLANVKADTHVAIFSVSQSGKTSEEVNTLIDKRISQAVSELKSKHKDIEVYVDMISFVPVYEYEVEKKLFSKKNYNEIPVGFELKKNIHLKYGNPDQLNDVISIFSNNEIYDLVKVDYFSNNLELVKRELMTRAKTILQDKMKNYELLIGGGLASDEKGLSDGYKVVLPVEMYKSYEAYSSSSLNAGRSANVNNANKSITSYYQPVVDKDFDFVINPTVFEPVIQVMYEIKLFVNRENKQNQKTSTEYLLITPNGELKNLNIKKYK